MKNIFIALSRKNLICFYKRKTKETVIDALKANSFGLYLYSHNDLHQPDEQRFVQVLFE